VTSAAPTRARAAGLLAAVLLACVVLAAPGAAQDPTPAPAPSATPAIIPIPEIASKAEETAARLRAMSASLQPSADVQAIDAGSTALGARIDARARDHAAALAAGPALRALAQMVTSWQTERSTLAGWGGTLTWYANEQEKQIAELAAATDSWTATLEQARAANAPPAVIDRINSTLAAIKDTRRDVEKYRAQILALQDRVARETSTCDELIERLTEFRKKEVGQVFVRDTQPLLGALFARQHGGATAESIRNALRDEVATLPEFAQRAAVWLLVQAALLIALCMTFRKAQQRAQTWVDQDRELERATRIFGFPYSAALIVTIALANWLYPWAPHLVTQLLGVVGLVPVVRIVRALVQPRLKPAVYALACFYVMDRVRDVVSPVPPLEQTILMAEMAIGIIVLLWMLRRGDLAAPIVSQEAGELRVDDDETPASSALRTGARFVLAAFVIALVSGLLGFMRLAHLVGGGTLIAAYLATALFACVSALDGLVAYALRARPLRLLRSVRRHRPLLQTQAWRVLRWAGVLFWILATLYQFQILDPIAERVGATLTTTLGFGAISVTLGDVIGFGITVWVSFLLSRFVRFVLEEDVFPTIELPRGVPYAISSLIHYVILISGTLLAFAVMGLDLNRFTILAGALGVGVGFGLQNVVNNFVSGLILLFERPIQVGDVVKLKDVSGEVKRIGIRSSTVRTGDGADVILPNGNLIADPVINWTLTDRTRKITLDVRAAYGNEPERVIALLVDAAKANERVMGHPEPVAQLVRFGDIALEFTLEAWISRHEQGGAAKSEIAIDVYRRLRAAGIEIPVAPTTPGTPPTDGGEEPAA
jgi:small-conductance mechanosensitive channel